MKTQTEYNLEWEYWDGPVFGSASRADIDRIPTWLLNFDVIKRTIPIKSVSDLPKIQGSALVIDKSMASTQFYKHLANIKNYDGTIIFCDRALYPSIPFRFGKDTVQHGPDYVCNLDSSPLCISFFDRPDVKAIMDKMAAVFSVTTNPLTIRHWHGDRYFFTPWMMSASITKTMMQDSNTPFMDTGGQVACFAYVLAYNLGANPIGIFGITHSVDKTAESEFPGLPHKRVTGKYGTCWQDPVYEMYNELYLSYIKLAKKKNVETINTSESGLLYSEDVTEMSLTDFIHKVKK